MTAGNSYGSALHEINTFQAISRPMLLHAGEFVDQFRRVQDCEEDARITHLSIQVAEKPPK